MPETPIPSLTSPEVQQCPFAAYARMRDEAPVYREPGTNHWVLTRYEDIKAVAADWETFSNATWEFDAAREGAPGQEAVRKLYEENGYKPVQALVNSDPPVHRRHRSAVNTAFSVPRVKALETYITQIVDELIDDFEGQGAVEFMDAFAMPLPMLVIADQLGVPRDMRHTFKQWSDSLLIAANVGNSPEVQLQAAQHVMDMRKFLLAEIARLVQQPRDCILNDIAHGVGDDGELLPVGERLAVAMQVLVAGNETTTSTLGHAMRRLAESPELQQQLRQEPDAIAGFVEECLRLDAPLQALFRRATVDTQIAGQQIKANEIVVLRWGAGNRDERRYACPDQVDVNRKDPRGHLSFGHGIHFCPGRELARAEIRIAIERLLARLGPLRLAAGGDALVYRPAYHAYGPRRVAIEFGAARA